MPIFNFIGYNLTELFRKLDNDDKFINKRVRLFIRRTMCREKVLLFLKKNTEAAAGGAEAVTGGVL